MATADRMSRDAAAKRRVGRSVKKAAPKRVSGAEGPKQSYKQTRTHYAKGIAPSQMMGGSNRTNTFKQRPDQAKPKPKPKTSKAVRGKAAQAKIKRYGLKNK